MFSLSSTLLMAPAKGSPGVAMGVMGMSSSEELVEVLIGVLTEERDMLA